MEYIIISQDCGPARRNTRVDLIRGVDYWDIPRMRATQISPHLISEIVVGPRTVLEIFDFPNFNGNSYKVINNTFNTAKIYKFGCPDGIIWKPKLRSFIVWTFDRYDQVYGVRYCSSNLSCREFELCMCRNGQTHPSWCPISKRRCMNGRFFRNDAPVPVYYWDNIDMQCFDDLVHQIQPASGQTYSDALIQDIAKRCNKRRKWAECP